MAKKRVKRKIRRIGAMGSAIPPADFVKGANPLLKLGLLFVFGMLEGMAEAAEPPSPDVPRLDNVEELIEDKDSPGTFIPKQ